MKRSRRATVELTSLLDLLFMMVFISLLQTKHPVNEAKAEPKKEESKPRPKTAGRSTPAKPVVLALNAVFHFYATPSNPSLPSGKFAMNGAYDTKTGALKLGGVSWINRPVGYDMIPLNGVIDPTTGQFRGRIEFAGCQQFTLVRTVKDPQSPIAGTWEGRYVCSQGETGLTLTIQ
jgi:hypothetical protein